MSETQRPLSGKTVPTYQEEFIKNVIFYCFREYVYVVIHKRSLYLYESKRKYEEHPEFPILFFNLTYMTF